MRKLVILYPAHFEQAIGGAELQINYLIKYAKYKYEIHYIFCSTGITINNEDKIILHPIKRKKYKLIGQAWFMYEREINSLLHLIKPDVIYTRLGSSWIYFAEKYAENHNILHVHAIALDYDLLRKVFSRFYPLGEPIENYLINKGINKGNKFISQNNFQKNALLSRYNKDSLLVKQMTPLCDVKKDWNKSLDKITIVWVANLKPTKRPELFIQLCSELVDVSSSVRCIMAGASNNLYTELLNKALKDYSFFSYIGQVSQDKVFDLFDEAYILVNTSIYEGFSNTYVQAWMRGCIVMALESNPDNIITDNNIGYVNGSVQAIADKIKYFIDNKGELLQMCKAAHDYAVENHSLENNIGKVLEYLKQQKK